MAEDNPKKDGVTVKQIEDFAKKYRLPIVLSVAFVLAFFFSFIFFGPGWGTLFASIGGILGAIFPTMIDQISVKSFQFIFKQEMVTQIIFAVVFMLISIFLPFLIYFLAGLHGGRSLYQMATSRSQ